MTASFSPDVSSRAVSALPSARRVGLLFGAHADQQQAAAAVAVEVMLGDGAGLALEALALHRGIDPGFRTAERIERAAVRRRRWEAPGHDRRTGAEQRSEFRMGIPLIRTE